MMLEMYLAGVILSFGFHAALALFATDSACSYPFVDWLIFVSIMSLLSWLGFGFMLCALLLDIYDKIK